MPDISGLASRQPRLRFAPPEGAPELSSLAYIGARLFTAGILICFGLRRKSKSIF